MKKKIIPPLSNEMKLQIIKRWRFSKMNSTRAIATEFNCSLNQVSKTINEYLSTKILP
jgi:DNA invertase Pin-like site-specific DNA recombinase